GGVGPKALIGDFGDTAALRRTVASPKGSEADIARRAGAIEQSIERVRAEASGSRNTGSRASDRFTIVVNFPQSLGARIVHPALEAFADFCREKNTVADIRLIEGAGFIGLDGVSSDDDATLLGYVQQFVTERMQSSGFHPDTWQPAIIRNPQDSPHRISHLATDPYTYNNLDQ